MLKARQWLSKALDVLYQSLKSNLDLWGVRHTLNFEPFQTVSYQSKKLHVQNSILLVIFGGAKLKREPRLKLQGPTLSHHQLPKT